MTPMVMVMVMVTDPDHEKRNMNLHFDSPVNNEIQITITQSIILKRNGTFIKIFLKKNSYSTEKSVSRQLPPLPDGHSFPPNHPRVSFK